MPDPQKRARRWCFTINNPTDLDHFGARLIIRGSKYGIVAKEISPTTGTPHIQGYVNLPNAKTFNTVKKSLPRAHLQAALGTDLQNQTYCRKTGDFVEEGEPNDSVQGGMDAFYEAIRDLSNSELTISDNFPGHYIRYHKCIDRIRSLDYTPRTKPSHITWLYGKAGVGKTRMVFDEHGISNIYVKDNTPWWDGYQQHKVILIDDFDNQIPYRTLLRILDRYPYNGQVKGSYVEVNSPYIYITCEHHPRVYWNNNELDQITRRLCEIILIK